MTMNDVVLATLHDTRYQQVEVTKGPTQPSFHKTTSCSMSTYTLVFTVRITQPGKCD